MAINLADLLTMRTAAQIYNEALSLMSAAPLPVANWRTGGPYKTIVSWRGVAAHVRRIALVLLLLLGGLCACVTPLDRARRDLASAAQVAAAAQGRLRTWDAQHQQELVRRSKTRGEAVEALRLYRARRALVMEQARETEQVMDAAADELLLQDAPRAQGGALVALRSAAALKDAVRRLQDGR